MFIDTIEQYVEYEQKTERVFVEGNGYKIEIPCANFVFLAHSSLVVANIYNPNKVPDSKMELLMESILMNGFAYPVAVCYDSDRDCFVIVDGYHRHLIAAAAKYLGLLHIPIVVLSITPVQRLAGTWQFNKARGHHEVDLDAELIRALIEQGVQEDEISKQLGIDIDTVYRYKQVTGIVELFKNTPYSSSWEMKEEDALSS